MTLQEAKQKVASNYSYVDWYQLRAHCKGFEGDIDPRMLTYADEAAEIYCASQVSALTKELEKRSAELSRLRDQEQQLVEALREVIKTLDFEEEVHWLYKEIEFLLNNQPDEKI